MTKPIAIYILFILFIFQCHAPQQVGHAFNIKAPKPFRVHLKSGWVGREFDDYVSIDHFTNYAVDGGAATVLDLPLNPEKELKFLKLTTTANDVVIGLMAVSLLKN
ncbi:MAG: hypothetical protein RIC35_22755 [Marinoscillum sp.]